MIYTCFEMIRDCRENRAGGWSYFIGNYAPVVRKIIGHYRPECTSALKGVLAAIRSPEPNWFASLEPGPERPFVAELRRKALDELDCIAPPAELDLTIELETLAEALAPLTILEKQAVWLETMRYSSSQTGPLLRTSEATIANIREKAAERIRAQGAGWRATLLAGNGRRLGRQAAEGTAQCLAGKAFLDLLDGRTTWYGREEMERHVAGCWHCIDHFCRMVETSELLRGIRPLSEEEVAELGRSPGVAADQRPGWKRWFGAG